MDVFDVSKPKKRERAVNWTKEERDVLLEIIKSYRHILDNQANNANTIKLKNIVWNHITNRFHELSNRNRDVNQLRSFWKRLKMAARKKARKKINGSTSDNEGHGSIGDGDSNSQDESGMDLEIKSNDLNKSTEFDDDSLFTETCNTTSSKGPEIILLLESNQNTDTKRNEPHFDDEINGEYQPNLKSSKYGADNSEDYDLFTPRMRIQKKGDSKLTSEIRTKDPRSEVPTEKKTKRKIDYYQKEFMLKRYYLRLHHKNEMKLLNQIHQMKMDNLLLERRKIELEIERNELELELSKRKL